MNFKNLCKPFLIYIVFSIIIAIYHFTSQSYKNMNKVALTSLKNIPKHDKYLNKFLPKNVNMNKLMKQQIKNPNYIYMYLSSNLFMFVLLFVLCKFNHTTAAWVIMCISIGFQLLTTYFMSYVFGKYTEVMVKALKKNNR